jgi:hypothetical protein
MKPKPKPEDPLDEIRAIRRQMAEEFNYDPHKAGAYFRRCQKQAGVKIYRRQAHAALVK